MHLEVSPVLGGYQKCSRVLPGYPYLRPQSIIISDNLTETLITGSHLYENRIKIKYWDRPLLGSGFQGTVYKV
jgi:hypothetical protein